MTEDDGARVAVPETLDEALSPDWLTTVLGRRFPGVRVREVHRGPVVSRISTNVRFTIECDGAVPEGLPRELCVKGYFTDVGRSARAAGVAEAHFYRDLRHRLGVRTLDPLHADLDEGTDASVVITEDVCARGAVFLDPLSAYGPDDAADSLEQLARLHAATWMDDDCGRAPWLANWLSTYGQIRGVAEIESNFEGPIGAEVPEPVRDAARLHGSFCRVAADAASAAPWCVIHGDPHAANLYLDDDGRPCLIDWQTVQRGPWYIDAGYHLAATLSVEDRRSSERELVRHYLAALRAGGVDAPGEDEAWQDLRRGMIHGFYMWGITLKVDPPITHALLERLGTAVDDHDAFAAV